MKQIDTILQKEMTRKEFLATLGFGIASILGFSNLLRLLFSKGHESRGGVLSGYGASVYGGGTRRQ